MQISPRRRAHLVRKAKASAVVGLPTMKNLDFAGDTAAAAQDAAQFQGWSNSRRVDGVREDRAEESDVLTSFFLYLADGFQAGNLPSRAAALLLFFRSDLVPAASYGEVAARLGLGRDSVANAMRILRDLIPARAGRFAGITSQSGVRPVVDARKELLGGLITAKDLAAKLGVNWQTLNRRAKVGRFPSPVKVGRHQFYSLSQVEAFLNRV